MFRILTGYMPASLQNWGNKANVFLGRLGWVGRHWATSITLLVVFLTFFFNYVPDALSSRTYQDVIILDAQQNSSNYVVKLELPSEDHGLPAVEEVRNVRQLSDLHYSPSSLQSRAASIAEHNRAVRAKQIDGELVKVSVRLSGFGFGDAHRSSNITQIEPTLPSFIYNLIGWLVVVLAWILPVLVVKLLLWKRNPATYTVAVLMLVGFVLDWYIL